MHLNALSRYGADPATADGLGWGETDGFSLLHFGVHAAGPAVPP